MKVVNLAIYLASILIPIYLIIYWSKVGTISTNEFVIYLLIYSFVYHPTVSGFRLLTLKKLSIQEFIIVYNPITIVRFYKFLYSPL